MEAKLILFVNPNENKDQSDKWFNHIKKQFDMVRLNISNVLPHNKISANDLLFISPNLAPESFKIIAEFIHSFQYILPVNILIENNSKLIASQLNCFHSTRIIHVNDLNIYLNSVLNTTPLIQSANAKMESDKNYESLVNDLHEGMLILNFEHKILSSNAAFQSLFGYTEAEIENKNLKDFVLPEKAQKFDKIFEDNNTKSTTFSIEMVTKVGEAKAIQVSKSPWRNNKGEIIGSVALITDITNILKQSIEIKRRYDFEKRIFNISSRFVDTKNFDNKVIDSLNDIAALCNAQWVDVIKMDWNKKRSKIEYSWPNKINNTKHIFNKYPTEQLKWMLTKLSSYDHLYIKDTQKLSDEANQLKHDLLKHNISNSMSFPIFVGLKLYGFLSIMNIAKSELFSPSEFILLRNAGELISNSIQRKLNEDYIKNLNEQLNEKTKETEQVLYITSHDIRSPLVNIIGFTNELNKSADELMDILNKEVLTDEDKESIRYLISEDIPEVIKYINAGGKKIDSLLNGLLKLSRLSRVAIESAEIDTSIVVKQILESMEYQLQLRKINVKTEKLPVITTDRNLFTQIITNLIDNAVKYSDENKQSFIHISSHEFDDHFVFKVKDNGIGIAPDKQEKIFEIFSRLNPGVAEGEGIGLNIIKKSVERLNGKIQVSSAENEGCEFSVEIMKV